MRMSNGFRFLILGLLLAIQAFGTIELSPHRYQDHDRFIVQYVEVGSAWNVRARLPKSGTDSFCARLSQGEYLKVPACLAAHTASLRLQRDLVQTTVAQVESMQRKLGKASTEGDKQRIREELEKATATLQAETRRLEELGTQRVILREFELDLLPAPEVYPYFAEKDPEHVPVIRQWAALFQAEIDKREEQARRQQESERVAQVERQRRAVDEEAARLRAQQRFQEERNRMAAYDACLRSMESQQERCDQSCLADYQAENARGAARRGFTQREAGEISLRYRACYRSCSDRYDVSKNCHR